ncbi:MAG: bifunctional adenosylcobinamide kinase/adenosylcobinamide-phosphate guanylyltransferase [Actinomycetota bacterium]|nr:bifunctional adenosylcobinamide kinase/adenosylcobinamide-phosphate guanylyltransferase [Actinomycetota bacterium]
MEGLLDHGDRQVPKGALDLAVNVLATTPEWLRAELAAVDLAAYPDPAPALAAVAQWHGVPEQECLLVNGAAEAFWLIAQALRPRLAVCVHPSFTAPEAALRASGVPVRRVVRDPADGFALDPGAIPEEADLVVFGRPDNPTGRVEPLAAIAGLTRPGRVVVVDEAFADFLPDASGLHPARIPGVVCVRSLTKLWGLAGLRVGYLLAEPTLVGRLAAARQPWPVNALAIRATELLSSADDERRTRAADVAGARRELVAGLASLPVQVWESPANFLLLRSDEPDLRERLLDVRIAVRRGETFPGLDTHYVRVATHPDPEARARLLSAVRDVLGERPASPPPAPAPRPPASRTLILGGARSGKSRHAQQLLDHEAEVLYIAPGPVPDEADADWAARVAAHRRSRPATWTTLETRDVAAALADADVPVLVDCLATWLSATMTEVGAWESADGATDWQDQLDAEVDRLLEAWRSLSVPAVAVSNEVGSGVVPGTRSGVLFRDALGRLNQRLADATDDVRLVVAGRVQRLPGGTT